MKSKRWRRNIDFVRNCNERSGIDAGVLAPSENLFKKLDDEVSLDALKKDVISSIQNREILIDRAREILSSFHKHEHTKRRRRGRDQDVVRSNKIKKLIFALHNASLCVVEAIISINLMSHSIKSCEEKNHDDQNPQFLSFAWMGENYLTKMLTDFQFMCEMSEVMEILLPERKTLFRNPFLLPLDLDEIVGYEPDSFCTSSESKLTRMSRVPWNINIGRIKRAASRILFEEHRAIYGDKNVVHVFPKMLQSTSRKKKNVVEIGCNEYPRVDVSELKQMLQRDDGLMFDDALVLACVRLFLGRDIESVKIHEFYIPRDSVLKLAKQPLATITDELCTESNELVQIFIESPIIYTIYVMLMRSEIKLELLSSNYTEPMKQLKLWLLNLITRQWTPIHCIEAVTAGRKRWKPHLKVHHQQNEKSSNVESTNKILSDTTNTNTSGKFVKDSLTNLEPNAIVSSAPPHEEDNDVEPKDESTTKEGSPIPIWASTWIEEGSKTVIVDKKEISNELSVGDRIRLGYPFQSRDYTISSIEDKYFVLDVAFQTQSPSREELLDRSTERLYSPKGDHPKSDESKQQDPGALQRKLKTGNVVRIWKVIKDKDDKRLEWRKQFDHGFIPWFPLSLNRYGEQFRIKIDMKTIQKNCYDDSRCDPQNCTHQQRLHFFEKVSLDDIIIETFNTVCHSWHPTTPNIDNVKWAKLARTMKFLSNVKNANHEVDMAFFRHSHQRKLDPNRFKSVLVDMALHKYPSARYDGGEALANLLWTTVATLPQVNRMIWTKAQMMAIKVELRRTCAQIRISARFRSWRERKTYDRILTAALCLSKNIRRMIAQRKRAMLMDMARFYRFYRIRHYSAIVCQKYWRRYVCVVDFIKHKRMVNKKKESEVSKIWEHLRRMGRERIKNLVFREVVNVQSVLTIISMFLLDKILEEEKSIKLVIKVYVPGSKSSFTFKLNENEVRDSLERFILRRGPLSWNEMLKKDALMKLKERLMAKVVRGKPIITFCRRDIAEKGNLMTRQLFENDKDLYILSFYRSPYDIVVRLYHPESCEQLRTIIDIPLLTEWLREDQAMKEKEALGMLRIRDIAQGSYRARTNLDDTVDGLEAKKRNKTELPTLLKREKEDDLVTWLKNRIQVIFDEKEQRKKIVLQYQAEAEFIERVAKKFQSIWRANCAKKRARKEVHNQYEKRLDWESKTFFYVHTKTGIQQWTKPALLRDDEDIKDPPDEWREMEYTDPETSSSRTYYMNPFTGQSSWLTQNEAAQIVQRKFRQRQTQLLLPSFSNFSQVVKAVSMIQDTEVKYKQQPSKLSNRVNYALLCHCIRLDINTARSLYKDAIVKSTQHPVIARAYGIFILATCQAPLTQTFEKACHLFQQAQKIDPDQKLFQIAKDNFFYWAVVMNPNNGMALLNYALLHQCILGEFHRAEKIYIRALTKDPANECIAQNFKLFQDQRYPGGYYEGSGVPNIVVKRSNVFQNSKEWGEWKKMIDPLSSKPKFKTFWLNVLDKTTSFEEPDWKVVWNKRVQRSKRITSNMKSLWVEYYDDQLHATFIHNRSSGQFVWQQ